MVVVLAVVVVVTVVMVVVVGVRVRMSIQSLLTVVVVGEWVPIQARLYTRP